MRYAHVMVFIKTWNPEVTKFHLYILHGVAEHSGRYDEFAKAVNAIGGKVFCQDHKGHGRTAAEEGLAVGNFHEADPVAAIIEDAVEVVRSTSKAGMPWLVFAHSGGCLYAEYMFSKLKGDKVLETLKGVIFSGPPAIPSWIERVAFRLILNILVLINKGQFIINALTFGKYDKEISRRTGVKLTMKNEWLNSDLEEVKKYNEDPFCAHDMSFKFWRSFLSHISGLIDSSFRPSLNCPVLVCGGDMDGATDYGRSLDDLMNRLLTKSNATSADRVLFKNARHEILAEKIKEQVIRKLVNWIKESSNLKQKANQQ